MAYLYDGIATTQLGKIIYRRKPHPFGGKDIKRIIKKIGLPRDPREKYEMLLAADAMLGVLAEVASADVADRAMDLRGVLEIFIGSVPEFEGFGGGTFGGAGASGPIDPFTPWWWLGT